MAAHGLGRSPCTKKGREGGGVSHENENKSSTVQESIHYWRTRRGVYEVWSQS